MRYFADIFDGDGKWYVFDEADAGAECAGPFATEGEARQSANDLNTDNTHPQGLRPHMIQRRINDEAAARGR